MKKNKEKWMDTQDQKILLNECKDFIMDFIMSELDNEYIPKGKLMDRSRELIIKLKDF